MRTNKQSCPYPCHGSKYLTPRILNLSTRCRRSSVQTIQTHSFYFFTNLIHLVFFTIFVYLSLHVSDQSAHHQEDQMFNYTSSFWCSVVDLSWVAAGVSLTPMATHDRSMTEGTTPEAACVINP